MSQYPRPKARGYHTAIEKLSAHDIAKNEALRIRVIQCRHTRAVVAFAGNISIGHLNKWLCMSFNISPEVRDRISAWLDKNP